MIHVVKLEEDIAQQTAKTILGIKAPKGRVTRVFWTDMNRTLVTSHDGGIMRKWDSEVGVSTRVCVCVCVGGGGLCW
jgi:translation initiation factor 3 subunit I